MMLAVSSSPNLFQNLGWEFPDYYSTELTVGGTDQQQQQQGFGHLDNLNLFDDCGVSDYPLLEDHELNGGRGESPPLSGSGSGDNHDHDHRVGDTVLAKKRLHHNASERDRRKKINCLYSSLRALLPASDLTKKKSIPTTVGRVLKYIPELQKEVEDLTQIKQELLSKTSAIEGTEQLDEEEKPSKRPKIIAQDTNTTSSSTCSISIEKVEQKEIVIHISTSQMMDSLPELLLLLETTGFHVIHLSSLQTFGGRAFYNLHLAMEGSIVVKYETLKEELLTLILKQRNN